MKKSYIVLIVIAVVLVVVIGSLVGSYNGLVSARENVDSEYSNIDVQLKRRTDLIPNLVNTVKGYAAHEESVIEKVTTAREHLINASGASEKAEADAELTSAINALMVIVENYPDLKANTNFINLQDELAGTENRIATARRDYNNAVSTYNKKIKTIPNNIIAGIAGFEKADYFEVKESEKEVPSVDFS